MFTYLRRIMSSPLDSAIFILLINSYNNMNGRTHRYIALMIVTLAVTILSAVEAKGFWIPLFTFAVMVLSILFYGKAADLKLKKEEIEKIVKKPKVVIDLEQIKKLERITWFYKKIEACGWFLLFFIMIFTIITADFLPNLHRGVSIGLALLALPITGIAGSFFSDWDWDWGPEFHRNPWLHSYLIPFSIWIFGMIVFPFEFRYFNIISGIFCLAYATHLFADCIPERTTGFFNILRQFFNFNQSPGDIRQIPKHWEHRWLFLSGVLLLGCFGLSIPRMYGIAGFDWAGVSEDGLLIWSPQIFTLIMLACIGIAIWFGIYFKALILMKIRGKHKPKKPKAEPEQSIPINKTQGLDAQLPQIKQEVVKIFEVQPVISTRAMLFKALEKASHDIPVEHVFQRLKSDKFIIFSRAAPAGFKLGPKDSNLHEKIDP